MELNELQTEIEKWSKEKQFFDGPEVNIDQKLLLAVGELIEAQNEIRDGRHPLKLYYEETDIGLKPCGFPIELADGVIRHFELAANLGINLGEMIMLKMIYNWKRPIKHGKKF